VPKLVPVPTPFFHQLYVGDAPPFVGVGVKVTAVPEQIVVTPATAAGEETILTAGVTNAFTVIVIVLDVTVAEEGQVALLVMSQVTVCPLVSVVVVNVVPPDPAFTPFTFHWYEGDVPPFAGVAVNVIIVPAQTLVVFATIFTAGTIDEETLIVTEFEVTEEIVLQVADEVTVQVITSLFANVELEYELAFVPIFTPFFFH